jgi:hypothetical protein
MFIGMNDLAQTPSWTSSWGVKTQSSVIPAASTPMPLGRPLPPPPPVAVQSAPSLPATPQAQLPPQSPAGALPDAIMGIPTMYALIGIGGAAVIGLAIVMRKPKHKKSAPAAAAPPQYPAYPYGPPPPWYSPWAYPPAPPAPQLAPTPAPAPVPTKANRRREDRLPRRPPLPR